MLKFDNVSLDYGSFRALDGINLHAADGADHVGQAAEADAHVVVDGQPGHVLHGLHQQLRPAERVGRVELVVAVPGDRYVGVARYRHDCGRGVRPQRRHVNQEDRVGPPVSEVAAGGQVLLLLGGEVLPAVRADQQPVATPPGGRPTGIVRQHRLTVQRRLPPQCAAQDAGADQQHDDHQSQRNQLAPCPFAPRFAWPRRRRAWSS